MSSPHLQSRRGVVSVLVGRAATLVVPLVVVVVADRLTKSWIRTNLWEPPRELVIVPGWLELTPVANKGIAFGLVQEAGGLLALVAVVVLSLVAARSWREVLKASFPIRLALGLIGGGAIGNVVDRAQYTYVTDFIHVPPIWLFQVFNIADASICVGAALLAVTLGLGDIVANRRARRQAVAPVAPEKPESL